MRGAAGAHGAPTGGGEGDYAASPKRFLVLFVFCSVAFLWAGAFATRHRTGGDHVNAGALARHTPGRCVCAACPLVHRGGGGLRSPRLR